MPRRAHLDDADALAGLLHAFNTEFQEPSPEPAVLAARLRRLLAEEHTLAVVAGDPPSAFALVSLRPTVWDDSQVASLDELYVEPSGRGSGTGSAVLAEVRRLLLLRGVALLEVAVDGEDHDARRFYERHGFRGSRGPGTEPAAYFSCELR